LCTKKLSTKDGTNHFRNSHQEQNKVPTFKTPIIAILLGGLALTGCQSGSGSATAGKGEAAAVVNGTKISVAEVDRVTAEQAQGQQAQLSQLELASARLQVLESLIQDEIMFQRAKKDNLMPTEDEITSAIQKNKSDSGMTEDAFQKRLKETNQNEQEFREDVRKQLAVKKLQDKLNNQIKVTDREVEDYFKSNPPVAEAGIALSQIVIDAADNGARNDAKTDAEAKTKIEDVYGQLKRGGDFATVARGQSEDESAQRGGDIGFIPAAQMVKTFGQQLAQSIAQMSEGQITPPLLVGQGRYIILKMTGKRTEDRKMTLEESSAQIRNAIVQQRSSLLSSALMASARNEAKVENYLIKLVIDNPNSLGVLRPVAPASAASPQASGSPAATSSPAAATKAPATAPAASAATTPPTAAATPAASPKK
jgi:peptidyl-prolyl cis-trans isomerase SurA